MVGAVEGIGDGLVNRHRNRFGRRIGIVAGVNRNGFVAHLAPPALYNARLEARVAAARVLSKEEPLTGQ